MLMIKNVDRGSRNGRMVVHTRVNIMEISKMVTERLNGTVGNIIEESGQMD